MLFEVRTPDRSDLFLPFRQSPSPASFWLKYQITVVCAWLAFLAWLFHFSPVVRAWAEVWRVVSPYLSEEIWSQSRFAIAIIVGWVAVVTKLETIDAIVLGGSLIAMPALWGFRIYRALRRRMQFDLPATKPLVEVGDSESTAPKGLVPRKRRRSRWPSRYWRGLWAISLALFLLTWGSNQVAILLICGCAFVPLALRACIRCFDLAAGSHKSEPLEIVHLWVMIGLLVETLYFERLDAEQRLHGLTGPAARAMWQVKVGMTAGLAKLWKAFYTHFRWHAKRLGTGLVFAQYVARVATLALTVVVLECLAIRIGGGPALIRQSDALLTAVVTLFPGLGLSPTSPLVPALGIGLGVMRWLLFGIWLSVLVPMFGRSQARTFELLEGEKALMRKAWYCAKRTERGAREVVRRLGDLSTNRQVG